MNLCPEQFVFDDYFCNRNSSEIYANKPNCLKFSQFPLGNHSFLAVGNTVVIESIFEYRKLETRISNIGDMCHFTEESLLCFADNSDNSEKRNRRWLPDDSNPDIDVTDVTVLSEETDGPEDPLLSSLKRQRAEQSSSSDTSEVSSLPSVIR